MQLLLSKDLLTENINMNWNLVSLTGSALIASSILVACGGGSSVGTNGGAAVTSLAGVLNDAPVKGVCYSAQPSGLHGSTDSAGTYNFNTGDSVTFWIDVSGSGCGATAANSLSTTGISLGAITPIAPTSGGVSQTFVLSLSAGPQVAEALQALNHGSTSSMDVSGITLANTASLVSNINQYLATGGLSQVTQTLVGTLFQSAQASATVASAALNPALRIVTPASFQTDVVNSLANTVSSGLGTAPTTVSIPAGRIVFAVTSGTVITTNAASPFTVTTAPFTDGHITYFDGSGNGVKVRALNSNTFNTPLANAELSLAYSIAGNVVTKTTTLKNGSGTVNGSATDATTIKYDDGHGSFYSGSFTKTFTSGAYSSATGTYSGSNIRLTPLTSSMLAGKTITIAAPACANGISTMTFDANGTTSTNSNCGGEIATYAAATNVPGVLVRSSPLSTGTMNDGSILYVGLDGPTVAVGSALVFVTENNGYAQSNSADYPAWGRLQILSVR
jgi:hypothetical protein